MASKQPPPNQRMKRIQARLRASMFSGRAPAPAAAAPPRPTCKAVRRGYGRYPNLARIHPQGCKLRSTVRRYPGPGGILGGQLYRTVKTNKRGQIKTKIKEKGSRAIFNVTYYGPPGQAGAGMVEGFIWGTSVGDQSVVFGLHCGLLIARKWGLIKPNGSLDDSTTTHNSVAISIPVSGRPQHISNSRKPARVFRGVEVEVDHNTCHGVYQITVDVQVSANALPILGVQAIRKLRKQGLSVAFT